jgi:hypothetical protein
LREYFVNKIKVVRNQTDEVLQSTSRDEYSLAEIVPLAVSENNQ